MKQMVASIVRELLHSMRAEPVKRPKVLYIFCDSTAHEAYSDHFIHLKNHGIEHDLLFLDGETSSWLGISKVECGGPGKIIAADEFAPAPLEVPLEYDGIVIPEIDLDNAARAALGMKGTIKSEIIFSALVLNKFVLVGEDSAGLKRADRRTLKTLELPKPYRNLFTYYKQELQLYGVEFVPAKGLAEWVVRKCGEAVTANPNSESVSADMRMKGSDEALAHPLSLSFDGRLLSADWVKQHMPESNGGSLTLGKATIVSPLAKDMLKDKGVSIQYRDEG